MDRRSENLANAASAVEDAIQGLPLESALHEATKKLREALTEFRAGRDADEETFFQAAREQYQKDGDLEFDSDAVVSISEDDGAYVQAWKWVEL